MTATRLEMLAFWFPLVFHAAAYAGTRGYVVENIEIPLEGRPILTVRPGPQAQWMAGQRVNGARMEARAWNCRVQWRLE